MKRRLDSSDLTERQQLHRLRAGWICFVIGGSLGVIALIISIALGMNGAGITTVNAVVFPLFALGFVVVLAGIYPFLRGRGRTKRQCRNDLTIAGVLFIALCILVFIAGPTLNF
ncbi:MAG TPA: hypothetical protein VHQ86_03545 [Candidatus Saccharimonadia bacterium]|nr:hypothetical protein [Candidatus Saccharimonadia bacterium]